MKTILLTLLLAFMTTGAYASCAFAPDRETDIRIGQVSRPVFDAEGSELNGCLLHTDKGVLGYTEDDKLCMVTGKHVIRVRLSYSCCDSGPDYGDVACTVRSKPAAEGKPAHGTGVTVSLLP